MNLLIQLTMANDTYYKNNLRLYFKSKRLDFNLSFAHNSIIIIIYNIYIILRLPFGYVNHIDHYKFKADILSTSYCLNILLGRKTSKVIARFLGNKKCLTDTVLKKNCIRKNTLLLLSAAKCEPKVVYGLYNICI